ncbi:uncharacterized protein LOC127850189 isoform X2 [Dreissena polymorpha]|uniref:uncharacterized protein LOC127850189 isoform X2 n=1 Tax=Dreissena polymorpha TaxID=45954 RepID=UPI00226482AC|nr:uncharacterized protein LOC127850189 isoform X2 [Dreissena polymorpha]
MQRSASNQQASGYFPFDPSEQSSYTCCPGSLKPEEGQCDATPSENTASVYKSCAHDATTDIFAQIIESYWEIEDEDDEDEADAIGDGSFDEVDGIGEEMKHQSHANGVCHYPKEGGARLRLIADALNNRVDPSQNVRDVTTKIVSSTTFEQFMEALPREAAKTIGWDQVALYWYIIRTSITMVGDGTDIKNSITSYAKQYFQSTFSDWINSQPLQWDSIVDVPIVD